MLKFSGSSYLVSGQNLRGVGARAGSARAEPAACAAFAIVRGTSGSGVTEHREKVTGVVSGRTYHTALLSGRQAFARLERRASTGLFATILEATRAESSWGSQTTAPRGAA